MKQINSLFYNYSLLEMKFTCSFYLSQVNVIDGVKQLLFINLENNEYLENALLCGLLWGLLYDLLCGLLWHFLWSLLRILLCSLLWGLLIDFFMGVVMCFVIWFVIGFITGFDMGFVIWFIIWVVNNPLICLNFQFNNTCLNMIIFQI